ncbi:50S ribosomal protein L17 [Acanthopleuribacter pedis]|uniref:Large ribosomal subunit protein bL17 n=1 Tax=Acanthopleuribacter pedis TaxID=442870 RepID=A0A8J7QPJ8_9BACT|nr:50S ribosomal protein L17 [Acanthopleuribacter pedis]MBO1322298.1 50S ribosomal protein L17 [Acanthopleuribacter pedis]
MRHRKGYSKLNRNTNQRKALLKGLAISLFEHGRITTTVAKAKELRRYAERLITIAKQQTPNAHRVVFSRLQNKEITKKLLNEYGPTYKDRNGGYTRILKKGRRLGDGAEMAFIELVGYDPMQGQASEETAEA